MENSKIQADSQSVRDHGVVHTPGPWTYQERSDVYTHIVRGPDGQHIIQFRQDTTGVSEANARMASVGPEAIGLLERMLTEVDFIGGSSGELFILANSLIAKSNGTSPEVRLAFGGTCRVPNYVAICPECPGNLIANCSEWDAETGSPSAIEIQCCNEYVESCPHGFNQADWQHVIDSVNEWAKVV